ncbi:F0F1 ATP synthase subunit A [soil metagenome]
MSQVLATVSYGGNWEVPPIFELFEWPAIAFEDTYFAINRVATLALFAALLVAGLFLVAFRSPKIVPGKVQNACEAVIEFIREQVAFQVIGAEGAGWVPLLTTIFAFVLVNNWFEVVPFISFPTTSRMALPAVLTALVYVLFVGVGIKRQGALTYFRTTIFPPGAPKLLYPLLGPIELVSNFISRPLTLAIRLFANMLAGHILLTLIFVTIHAFLVLGPGLPVGIVALAAAPLMIGFELVVGLLQAYIFTILTAVYISSSLEAGH